ncbi:MAG: ribosome maturation factor RimM [Pseudomonadales bacterium]
MMSAQEEFVVIGKIATAHGIKGWVKVFSYTEHPAGIFDYQPLHILRGGKWQLLEIDEWRPQAKALAAHIKDCDDRNTAESYRQCELGVSIKQFPELAVDEFYWHQLQGLAVYTAADEQLLGQVEHLMETGANDVLVIRPSKDSIDKRERLVPYLPGEVIIDIDLDKGRMIVDWDAEF